MAAVLLSGASTTLAYGQEPSEPIDPDCEPQRALEADPALVEPADGVCPPGEPAEQPREPEQPRPEQPRPEQPRPPGQPQQPRDLERPQSPGQRPASEPQAAPPERPAPQRLPRERAKRPLKQHVAPRPRAEQREASGGAEAPPTRRRARRQRSSPQRASGGISAPAPAAQAPVSSAPAFTPAAALAEPGIPAFLISIYRSAGRRYDIPWEILAAINEIETAYGRNLNISSAGAMGWMQFMPGTWQAYGVDANRDGVRNPYDPVDAIHSAANYLAASGYERDPRAALWAYNHADWYVNWVLARAEAISVSAVVLRDPLRRARRLYPRFAARLARVAQRAGVPWELTLAVLRVRGHSGRVPASPAELRALTRRLAALGARKAPRRAVRRLAGERLLRARRIVALAHYHRAVGLRGLVRGLERVRPRLARLVLKSSRLEIYGAGRTDIKTGVTDVRVLVLLRYLASRYNSVTVTSLTSGHSFYTASGNVSAHSYGRAVDIAALNGTPIFGHQAAGGLTERALWNVLLLPRELRPRQLISLFELGGPSFAMDDHADHIHVGY